MLLRLQTKLVAWLQSNNEGQAALDALADPKQAEQLQLAAYLTAASKTTAQVCCLALYLLQTCYRPNEMSSMPYF